MRDSRFKPCKRTSSEGSRFQPLLCTWQEEKKEEESGKRSKRKEQPVAKWGPQAPGGRNEGFSAGSAFDPARHQDANGDSGCEGYLFQYAQEMDRKIEKGSTCPTQTAATDARGRNLVKENGKEEEIGKRKGRNS